jgi:mutator protein MutT
VTPEVCVGAIAVEEGKLLLIRRGHGPAAGEWSIPGGRVEAGETLAEAVVRELMEETGVEGVCDRMVGWVERIGVDRHFVILDFTVTVLCGPDEADPQAGGDAAEAAWVSLDEVAHLNLVEGLLEFLHEHGIVAVIT